MSDGTKRVAYILSELAHFPSIPGKVIPGQIVLIDEPELGIHPKLLKELMNFVSELAGERQVIVTTHSPEVLDVLSRDELDRIIIAEYQGANGSIFRGMTSEEKITAEKYLKDMYLSDFWKYSDFND